jgi:hypothetical protein
MSVTEADGQDVTVSLEVNPVAGLRAVPASARERLEGEGFSLVRLIRIEQVVEPDARTWRVEAVVRIPE